MPTVSVIVPTYNHEEFVLAALESVFAQTFSDYELIVVNDGSPDGTAEKLRPLALDGRIRYVDMPHSGQAAARNRGLAEASGRFVAFLDDDDLWPAEKLEWQTAMLEQSHYLAVGGGVVVTRDGRVELEEADGSVVELRLTDFFKGNPFFSPGQVLFRANALREVRGFDEGIWGADDLDLFMRLAHRGPILKVCRPALIYRMHGSNASRAVERMLVNGHEVIRKNVHLVDEQYRSRARRDAYRWLYGYAGRPLVRRAKAEIRRGRVVSALTVASNLRLFVRPVLGDRRLLRLAARRLVGRPARRRK